ncbi:MAG: iron-sulfur cluster assembly accessory protein [Planctomycetota bacterium]
MAITVTDTAAKEIQHIIDQQELDAQAVRLRVGVKGGGCSGFSYLLDLTEQQRDSDEVFEITFEPSAETDAETSEGGAAVAAEPFTLKVICDPKSYLYLNGTTIDFKDEIMGRGFVFSNPNATSSCGCGSSFSA